MVTTPDELAKGAQDDRPPMSTTSLPLGETDVAAPARVPPPVLASDVLLEDVAPREPGRGSLRIALAAMAAVFFAVGALSLSGLSRASGAWGALASGALTSVLAVVRVPYAARAALALTAALVPLGLGALGTGPLSDGAPTAWPGLAWLAMLATLPGVLLFRARFRALRAARTLLVFAYAASALALVSAARELASADAPLPTRAIDVAALGLAMAGLFGFMGAETTGMCGVWALGLVCTGSLRVLATTFERQPQGAVAAVGTGAALAVAMLGVMQLLAAWLRERARRVDVHRAVGSGAPSAPGPHDDGA